MDSNTQICQSCGMPLSNELSGTNMDGSLNEEYCKHCYQHGSFLIPDLTLVQQIERLTSMAMEKMNKTEKEARTVAESILPKLKRWKV